MRRSPDLLRSNSTPSARQISENSGIFPTSRQKEQLHGMVRRYCTSRSRKQHKIVINVCFGNIQTSCSNGMDHSRQSKEVVHRMSCTGGHLEYFSSLRLVVVHTKKSILQVVVFTDGNSPVRTLQIKNFPNQLWIQFSSCAAGAPTWWS